ncbi:MAG: DUF1275 domain-containing protein [Acidimicrobiaceae bacterium]|nr:DUF1275 domain-containing protein [Acidimicrobiaceae bacterium]
MRSLLALSHRYFADGRDGPLPALLLAMTAATGMVDAVSILRLGHVFVANMTGNIAFVAFGLARAKGFSVSSSLTALIGFVVGAALAGWYRTSWDRAHLLGASTVFKLCMSVPAVVIIATTGIPAGSLATYVVTALLAVSMGVQNASISRLAATHLSRTTVVTSTLTGLFVNLRTIGVRGTLTHDRMASLTFLFIGCVLGAAIVLASGPLAALGVEIGLLTAVGVVAIAGAKADAYWAKFPAP